MHEYDKIISIWTRSVMITRSVFSVWHGVMGYSPGSHTFSDIIINIIFVISTLLPLKQEIVSISATATLFWEAENCNDRVYLILLRTKYLVYKPEIRGMYK